MSLMLWLMLQLLLWWFIYEWEEETHLQDSLIYMVICWSDLFNVSQ